MTKPKSLFITSFLLCVVFMWFAISTMDYDRSRWCASFTAFRTAGWFIVGFPLIAGLGLAHAALFTLIGREIHRLCGWVSMLAVTAPLIVWVAYAGTPQNRFVPIVGTEAVQVATLERLVVWDSFNAGTATAGVISGPGHLMDMIIRHRSLRLERQSILSSLRMLDDETLPDFGDAYVGRGTVFYQQPDTGSIYFSRDW